MADNDIYNSQGSYERIVAEYKTYDRPAKTKKKKNGKPGKRKYREYFCKNPRNLMYFEKLFEVFEAKDLSYVRRLRLLRSFLLIVHATEKNLKDCDRSEINKILGFMHKRYKSPNSKKFFIRDMKYIWKLILPAMDERGRPDETIVPYAVRHVKGSVHKAKEKSRNDKISPKEFTKIVNYFSGDPKIQAYLTLAFESLARPQELLYTKMKDYTFYRDDESNRGYAKIQISEHGKEGTGILQCFDSWPYVIKWYELHPLKDDEEAFFFYNGYMNGKPMRPESINKRLRIACKKLKIKRITAYSIKRLGVTFDMMAGKKPQEIQHKARWTSIKQLQTYSKMDQEDAFTITAIKKGFCKDPKVRERYEGVVEEMKDFTEPEKCKCGKILGFGERVCPECKRTTQKARLEETVQENNKLSLDVKRMKKRMEDMEEAIKWNMAKDKEELKDFIKGILEKEKT